ncbi:MAG: methyltransferase domain-containing protein [Phycisphaerae bacterium]
MTQLQIKSDHPRTLPFGGGERKAHSSPERFLGERRAAAGLSVASGPTDLPPDARILRTLIVFLAAPAACRDTTGALDFTERLPPLLRRRTDVDVAVVSTVAADAARIRSNRGGVRHIAIPRDMPYGLRQKLILEHAVRDGYACVLCVPPGPAIDVSQAMPLLLPIYQRRADLVIGSRIGRHQRHEPRDPMGRARRFVHALATYAYNSITGDRRADVHATCRAIRVAALRDVPFRDNSDDEGFDIELLLQFRARGLRVIDVAALAPRGMPVGVRSAIRRACSGLTAPIRVMLHQKGFLYHPRFDSGRSPYRYRSDRFSVHQRVIESVPRGSTVLDLGCGAGHVARALRERDCFVVGVDQIERDDVRANTDAYHAIDLDRLDPAAASLDLHRFDVVLALDVIEHLADPEAFLRTLRVHLRPGCTVILSTANVAYWSMRLMLALGQFNYGRRGILDVTHKRLFTKATFVRTCRAMGFDVLQRIGVPPPVTDVIHGAIGRGLMALHARLSRAWVSAFGFQMILHLRPRPTVERLWEQYAGGPPRRRRVPIGADSRALGTIQPFRATAKLNKPEQA